MKFGALIGNSITEVFSFYSSGKHKAWYKLSLKLFLLFSLIAIVIFALFILIAGASSLFRGNIETFLFESNVIARCGDLIQAATIVLLLAYGHYISSRTELDEAKTVKSFFQFFKQKFRTVFAITIGISLVFNVLYYEWLVIEDGFGAGQLGWLLDDFDPYPFGLPSVIHNWLGLLRIVLPVAIALIVMHIAAKEAIKWKAILVSVVLTLMVSSLYETAHYWLEVLLLDGVHAAFDNGNVAIALLLDLTFLITVNAYLLAGYALCLTAPTRLSASEKEA